MTELQKVHFLNCKPILNVKDVAASLDYYCNRLGFTKIFSWSEEAGFCDYGKLNFAEVQRGSANIMMSLQQEHADSARIYLDLDATTDLDLLYQEFKERGAFIVEPPDDKTWHMREMLVKDLDDNFLRIGAPIKHENA
ncbi:MAG: VOC family protein [Nitrososphaera sp.]|jgi:uncharacterized glyoxalase superfamily protein PhnB